MNSIEDLIDSRVFNRPTVTNFGEMGADPVDVMHKKKFELETGTIGLSFTVDSLFGDYALISKDARHNNEGDFTVWVKNGVVTLSMENGDGHTEWLSIPEVLQPGETYHFAMTFGEDGIGLWLNGTMRAAEPEFKTGLSTNDQTLVVGGTRAWRSEQTDSATNRFEGEIGDVMIFDEKLGGADMIALAGDADMTLGHTAAHHAMMADLMPVFQQLHHGSDTLKEMLEAYGVSHHGHVMGDMAMQMGTQRKDDLKGTSGKDAINGGARDDKLHGGAGADMLQGGSGNDTVAGGSGRDILDGGEGEDKLYGGDGNDLLISRADGREGKVAYDPDRDEGDPYNELTNGKLYPNQPVPGGDMLKGGRGADIFYFQTLINAKERYIEKHTRDDGTINWHGVAGENDKIHDHWVDVIGNDMIADFSRSEGDRIVIEGHTTEIREITYGDRDGNGVMDHSVIWLYSDQGNGGGAHADDELGKITVYGDLVKESDIEHTAAPAYGIVATIEDLDEALAPLEVSENIRHAAPKKDLPKSEAPKLPSGASPVLSIVDTADLSGEEGDYMNVGHSKAMMLETGTIGLSFTVDSLFGDYALISKDARHNNEGDFTVWVKNGVVTLSMENGDGHTEWLSIPEVLQPGETYHFAMTFGEDGIGLWLNGTMRAAEPEFKTGLSANDQTLVVGGTRAWRSDQTDSATNRFEGEIGDVMIFDEKLGGADMIALAGDADMTLGHTAAHHAMMADLMPVFQQLHHGSDTLKEMLEAYGVSHHGHVMGDMAMQMGTQRKDDLKGTSGKDAINGGARDDKLHGGAGADMLQGGSGNDTVAGGSGRDILDGGEGEDKLYGGDGNDLLISRADGREGKVAYDPDRDEGDPYNELTNGKLYPNQPVPGGDMLKGGRGADIFYFQTLINAKERYIEKHTRDDGTINWHGVAGENDKIHDHWVDVIGNDMIADFSRSEGDRIVIEGHTTEIREITYGDRDGNGVMDHSVIWLYSDQGNGGGAHADDELGKITVYGDLVKESDIEHTAAPAYGIVATIEDLDEALAPLEVSENIRHAAPKKDLPKVATSADGTQAAFAALGDHHFSSEDGAALVFDHVDALDLRNGTIAFSFEADKLVDHQWLFSKDAGGNGQGHMVAYLNSEGNLTIRVQDLERSYYFTVEEAVEVGQTYDFAMSFGSKGLEVFLDGARVAADRDVDMGLKQNEEVFIIGANGWSNDPGEKSKIHSHFSGMISDVMVFDKQMSASELYGDEERVNVLYIDALCSEMDVTSNGSGGLVVTIGNDSYEVGDAEYVAFKNATFRTADIELGTGGNERMEGGVTADILKGLGGDDELIGNGNSDILIGGNGDDDLYGGEGRDKLYGDNGNDYLDGGEQNDRLEGGAGNDELKGNAGNDRFYGGVGDDTIYGHTWGEAGTDENDIAYYDGNLADYTFETNTWWHGRRGEQVEQLVITDNASGGADGFYEGRDKLMDIDFIVFADQTIAFDDLL